MVRVFRGDAGGEKISHRIPLSKHRIWWDIFLLLLTFSEKTAALGSGCLVNVVFKHLCNWGFINGFCVGNFTGEF